MLDSAVSSLRIMEDNVTLLCRLTSVLLACLFTPAVTAATGDLTITGDITAGGLTTADTYSTPVCRNGSGKLGNCGASTFSKIATVAASNADYSTPTAAMSDLASWCGTPSSSNRCLIWLQPGVFDLGVTSLTLQDYVDLKGSGQNMSIIQGQRSGTAVVIADSNSEISSLTIENNSASSDSKALSVSNSARPTISHVTLRSDSGASYNSYALVISNAHPTVSDSILYSEGDQGVNTVSISNTQNSVFNDVTIKIMRSHIESHCTISCSALNVNASDAHLSEVHIFSNGYAIFTYENTNSTTYYVDIDRSTITSGTYLLSSVGTDFVLSFGASKIETPYALSYNATLRCAASYDENYTALSANCL